MKNFVYSQPTKIVFGAGTPEQIGKHLAPLAQKVLLHYGGGSAVKSGLIDRVKTSLDQAGIRYCELGGVQPNPRLSLVRAGIDIVRAEGAEAILAVGGGSVIDSAKAIGVGALYEGDVWDFFRDNIAPDKCLPIVTVLTIPAAGSEASDSCVITNEDGPTKKGIHSQTIRPRVSILDPTLTYSLPAYQTAAGGTDIMAHVMERYFTNEKDVDFTDRLCEATLKTIIQNLPIVLERPDNYPARAQMMWASTLAHNDLLSTGRVGDWASHAIAHQPSALYDLTHGAALAIVFPAWMKYVYRHDVARFAQFAVTAAAEAMAHSGLDLEREDRARIGVALSSGIGGIGTLQTSCETGQSRGFDRVSPFFIPMVITNLAAGHIAIRFGLHGMCICPVAACAGGANAVGDAFRHIRDGYAEVMVAGGAEASITPLAMGGFTSMSALTDTSDPSRASIPFDKERSGFVMGEGAAILVLEELEHARARGAQILGEITGYGATCDAYHITAPDPAGTWSAACMEQALADAGVTPEAVDYINAHGTSTPLNDSGETAAIRKVFGGHADRLMVSSTKSMTGHLLGAAGAVEAIFTAMTLKEGFVPATIGYQVPDPACDLDIVPNEGRKADVRVALSNSLGFGGHNAAVVLKKWEE